jgi:hypothetical protein
VVAAKTRRMRSNRPPPQVWRPSLASGHMTVLGRVRRLPCGGIRRCTAPRSRGFAAKSWPGRATGSAPSGSEPMVPADSSSPVRARDSVCGRTDMRCRRCSGRLGVPELAIGSAVGADVFAWHECDNPRVRQERAAKTVLEGGPAGQRRGRAAGGQLQKPGTMQQREAIVGDRPSSGQDAADPPSRQHCRNELSVCSVAVRSSGPAIRLTVTAESGGWALSWRATASR